MLWLGDWQLHRAESGNELSWAYTFEWPLFAIFGIYFWVSSIRDELRRPAARRTGRARRPNCRPSRPMPTRPASGPRCAATASGTVWADPPWSEPAARRYGFGVTVEFDSVASLEFARYLRPRDTVAWGQACGEPLSLTEALVAQRAAVSGLRCFLGIPCADTVRPEHADHLRLVSYSGAGPNQLLRGAGVWTSCRATTRSCRPCWAVARCAPTRCCWRCRRPGRTAATGWACARTTSPPSSGPPGSSSPRSATRSRTSAARSRCRGRRWT